MNTIYLYTDNGVKLGTLIIAIVFFLAFVIAAIFFSPLLKQCIDIVFSIVTQTVKQKFSNVTKKEIIALVSFTTCIYIVFFLGIFFGGKFVIDSRFKWIDTDISTCSTIVGDCKDFKYEIVEFRDHDVYICDFSVSNVQFFDVSISPPYNDAVKYLSENRNLTIYYHTLENENLIVRIDALDETGRQGNGSPVS